MDKYDVIIVGGSTTGCWFAKQMAQRGHNVLLIEKETRENVSRQYDIVHMSKNEMQQYGMHIPQSGDKDFAFLFDGSPAYSPYGNYPKTEDNPETVVGLHKHEYIVKMQDLAQDAGAQILTGAVFHDLIRNDDGKIIGIKYTQGAEKKEAYAKIVADCSGIPSVVRTKLDKTASVENFPLTNRDLFFVVLYYIKYKDPNVNPNDYHGFFLNYKSWSAPSGDEHGAILGIGANYGYDYAEAVFEDFARNYKIPEYTIEKVEKWVTPYHRALYSFVDDSFIAMGDAAFLTKPNNGEGCTSSLMQGIIAANTIDALLKENKPLSRENLWTINKQYIDKQGSSFDSLRPMLMGFIAPDIDEAEYMFSKDLIYCKKILCSGGNDIDLTSKDILHILKEGIKAIITGKVKFSKFKALIDGISNGGKVTTLYKEFPETPESYFEWKQKADALWNEIGCAADLCDKELLKKLGY